MTRLTNELISVGGLVSCCAAAIQVNQLASGQAADDFVNYVVTGLTTLIGLGLTSSSIWFRRQVTTVSPDEGTMITSLDPIFAYFADDEAAKEAVRAVARAITERHFRAVKAPT
jgi:hypothetical protein